MKLGNLTKLLILLSGVSAIASSDSLRAEDADAKLAQQLANPVASLISVPLQYNYDDKYGVTDEGSKHLINVQPVIPFSVGDSFNVISRTILPVVAHSEPTFGSDSGGLGDTLQSFFLSPKDPTASGLIWGAGPALLLPTATDQRLGAEKWGIGPTAVGLRQHGAWTYGGLVNHLGLLQVRILGVTSTPRICSHFLVTLQKQKQPSRLTVNRPTTGRIEIGRSQST